MSDIDHAVEKKSGEVVVYGKKGRLFSIQEMAPQVPFFSLTMEENGIAVIYK